MPESKGILSVGIDIGTSTTQLVFSRLVMENTAGYFTVPRVAIVEKNVVYRSEIYTTPLKTRTLLDGDAVRELVAAEFARAGYSPGDTDTGAVIITGESARKENSALVLEKLSDFAGEFVVSTAGPDLESVIAGKGSGAQQYSRERGCTAVNLDVGGGTTNIVLFDNGRTVSKGCLDIGGRLVRVEPDFTVSYISPAAEQAARVAQLELAVGQRTSVEQLQQLCAVMAAALEQCLGLREPTTLVEQLKTPGSSRFEPDRVDVIFFSGGVADAIYLSMLPPDPIPYGDIGLLLGRAISESKLCTQLHRVRGNETIRATVVGAGSYTTSISGSTIDYSPELFPMKNLPVIKLDDEEQEAAFCGELQRVAERVRWFLEQSDSPLPVIALAGEKNPSYSRLKAMAGVLAKTAEQTLPPDAPLLLVTEQDMGKALGQSVRLAAPGRAVVSLDSIIVEQNDYIDMGRPLMNGLVVPVVVKTLIFG